MSTKLSEVCGYFTSNSGFQRQRVLQQLIDNINILEKELNENELKLKDVTANIQKCDRYIKQHAPLMLARKEIIESLLENAKTDAARLIQQDKLKQWKEKFAPIAKAELNLKKYEDIQNEHLSQKMILTESMDNKRIQLQGFLCSIGSHDIDAPLLEKAKILIEKIVKDAEISGMAAAPGA
ncbi:MAG: hypothetical protein K2Q33_08955 [Gammaproteobacteria bacterium]|nr:hypothetical protein [Gammaproteobacteria bacterium]